MNTNMTTTTDDPTHVPETIGDPDTESSTASRAADAEDRTPDEPGYGYGV